MSNAISACIARLVRAGKVSAEAGARAQKLADDLQGSMREELGEAGAEAQAALKAAQILTEAANAKKVRAAKQAIALQNGLDFVNAHPDGAASGLNALITRDINERTGGSVESRAEALTDKLISKIDGAFENFGTRAAGTLRPLYDIRDVVRELYGRDTGNAAAKTFAKGWTEAIQYAVDRAKAAGKSFQEMEPWRLPQFWEPERVKGNKAAWTADVKEAIGKGKLTLLDAETGLPVTKENIDARLDEAYRKIVVDEGKGVSSPFNAYKRSFHFKDADTWFQFMDKYGVQSNDLLGTMTGHLSGMAREIALMERLGPNHRGNFEAIAKHVAAKINLGESTTHNLLAMDNVPTAERSFKALTGETNAVESEALAGFLGAIRSYLSAAQLGSAVIPSIPTDSFTSAAAAAYNGLPVAQLLGRGYWDLFTDSASKRAAAARLGVVAHGAIDGGVAQMRYADMDKAPKLARGLARFVYRVTGLDRWTNVMKRTFTMEFLGHIADQARFGWNKVDPKFKDFLERHGFTKDEWDTLRQTPPVTVEGAKFFDTTGIKNEALNERLMAAIIDERKFAILEPDARVRGLATGGQARGSIGGELSRSIMQYKAFPMTMMLTHMRRAAQQEGVGSKFAYGVPFIAGLTLMGAVGLQAKQVLQGKDPLAMDSKAFWARAFVTGGALGPWGDLLNSAASRTGQQGFVMNTIGPMFGLVEDVSKFGLPNVREAIEGKPISAGANAANFARRYTAGTTIWWARAALDRMLWDSVQTMLDPHYRRSFQNMEQRARRDYGQDFWWRPGESAPDRAPDLGAAFPQ